MPTPFPLKTVGDLKQALASIDDSLPIAAVAEDRVEGEHYAIDLDAVTVRQAKMVRGKDGSPGYFLGGGKDFAFLDFTFSE